MEIKPFDFSGKTIRIIRDDKNDPWWVAVDVCFALGLTNPTEALRSLDDDEKNTLTISKGNRGNPNLNIINEPSLYRLLSRSNKKRAKKFQRWVFHDVLPSICKTGNYSIQHKLLQTYSEALRELAQKVKENEILKPKAQVYDQVSASAGLG